MKEIKVLEGKVVAPEGMKVGIVASRFNEIIVNKLLGGAVDGLVRHGVEEENITAAWVPGAFEIPVAASAMAKSGKYDAIICVGAVIRGDTTHYDYVCSEVSKGIAQVGLAEKMPVLFGVLTTENIEQAIERIRTTAAPLNAIRHPHLHTPCQTTKTCMNCQSADRLCNTWSITEKSFPPKRIKIILINEPLGL